MNAKKDIDQEMLPEYSFDYSKAKKNRFATTETLITVTLDSDVAKVFTTAESVNKALRAILSALPPQQIATH